MSLSSVIDAPSLPASPLDLDHTDVNDPDQAFPLTHGQLCFWMVHFLMGETANNLSRLLLKGPVDPGLMEKVLNGILQRHDSLRSRFGEIMPLQQTRAFEPLDMAYEDHSALTLSEQQDRIANDVRTFMAPFDLTRPPLLRVKLYRLNEREHLLLSVFPHIILDGSGVHIFEQEVIRSYRQLLNGKPLSTGGMKHPVPLAQYVAWEKLRASAMQEAQIRFWQDALQNYHRLVVPACYQATETGKHFDRMIPIPASVIQGIQLICQRSQVTFQMCMLAVVASSLGRFSKSRSLVLNSVLENRTAPCMETLYAPTLYLMPVPINLANDSTTDWMLLLPGIKRHVTQAYDNIDIPFSIMQGILAAKRWTGRSALWRRLIQMASRWIARLFSKSQLHPSFLADYLLMATPPNRISTLPAQGKPQTKRLTGTPDPMINVNILQSFYKHDSGLRCEEHEGAMSAQSLSDPFMFLPAEAMDGEWEDESVNIYIVMDNDQKSYFRVTCSCLNEKGISYLSDCLAATIRQTVH